MCSAAPQLVPHIGGRQPSGSSTPRPLAADFQRWALWGGGRPPGPPVVPTAPPDGASGERR
eukprot:15442912-Alexandrium_andersonii.AAC.1